MSLISDIPEGPPAGDPGVVVVRSRELCRREALFPPGSRALVLVSGGQDSVALLHVLASGALAAVGPASLTALHVNYHLRGEESDADEALVRELCSRLGVPLEVRQLPLHKGSGNLQERARDARRAAAREVAAARGADRIALGHTLDDQVETLLYRLGRYGGLAAFRAMLPRSDPWVRPLLAVRRRDTEAYCRAQGLAFAVDRGNIDPAYARTDIRGLVLPAWERALPGAVAAAGRAAEVAAETASLVDTLLERLEAEVRTAGTGAQAGWSVARLLALSAPERRALLYRLLERIPGVTPSRDLVLTVEHLLESEGSATADLGGRAQAEKTYGLLRLVPAGPGVGRRPSREVTAGEQWGAVPLPLPGCARWGGTAVTAEYVGAFAAPDVRREAYLDVRGVDAALSVRGFLPGDHFRPLGAPGTRKLKEVFSDLKVPAELRPRVPLVLAGERVLWVGGYALGEQGRIRPDTERVVRLAITEGDVEEE